MSLVGLGLLALGSYLTGAKTFSRGAGLWAAALVSAAWLALYSGHLVQPDVFTAGIASLVTALWLFTIKQKSKWLYFLLGIALTLQVELHFIVVHLAWAIRFDYAST